jgi:hypothetical protein
VYDFIIIGGGSAGAVSIDDPINTAGAANLVVTSGGAVTFIETGSLQTAASVTLSGTSTSRCSFGRRPGLPRSW